jgi:hypothetical protein
MPVEEAVHMCKAKALKFETPCRTLELAAVHTKDVQAFFMKQMYILIML